MMNLFVLRKLLMNLLNFICESSICSVFVIILSNLGYMAPGARCKFRAPVKPVFCPRALKPIFIAPEIAQQQARALNEFYSAKNDFSRAKLYSACWRCSYIFRVYLISKNGSFF
jgi:hypothetical protein